MAASEVLNVRCGSELKDAVEALASRDGLKPSSWAREVLCAVVAAQVPLAELQAGLASRQVLPPEVVRGPMRWVGGPRLNGQDQLGASRVLSGACLHPVHLRKAFPTFDLCEACGSPIPR